MFKAEILRVSLLGLLVPEDEGTTILRNVEDYLSNKTVSHTRRHSQSDLRESRVSPYQRSRDVTNPYIQANKTVN